MLFVVEAQILFRELHVQSGASWVALVSLLLEEAWTFLFPRPRIAIANHYFHMVCSSGYDLSNAATIKKS